MFKSNLTDNAKEFVISDSNDGFKISEEDMKLRGLGTFLVLNKVGLKTLN